MRALLLGAFVAVISVSAHADIIKCTFTEPFIDVQYSMTQSAVLIVDHGTDPATKTTIKSVSLQIMGPGLFELWDKNNHSIAKLSLDGQGSDGMSDTIFPYSVEWSGQKATYGVIYGGCTSNFQHVIKGQD